MSGYAICPNCGKKLKIWFSSFAALGLHNDECPNEFASVAAAKRAGVFCGTLANGDTFGNPDDKRLGLDGRKITP